jgi:GTP-binding protein EngB required for normal cell division
MLKNFRVKENFPRLVMIGNSNVGKSTISKFFLKNKKLATGSIGKHAGSTVTLKQYKDPALPFHIIDLPGFGAMTHTSKNLKEKIHDEIIQYVERDKSNIFLILIIINGVRILDELKKYYYQDATTIPLTFEFLTWISEELEMPCALVINKIDKLKKQEITQIVLEVKKVLDAFHIKLNENPQKGLQKIFTVSAKNGVNMNELKQFVEKQWRFIEQ